MEQEYLSADAGVGPCPGCGTVGLRAVSDGEETNFLCGSCGCCWHFELGWVERVNPVNCPGCPSKAVCSAAHVPYGDAMEAVGSSGTGVAGDDPAVRPSA